MLSRLLVRILLIRIYRSTRLDRLNRIAWMSGKTLPDHINENMSQSERSYYKEYLSAIDQLNQDYSVGSSSLDLTVDLTPPKELYIEVRIKKDYGAVMLPESGEVHLQRNTTHLLRRSEVDHLIKQGIVAEIIWLILKRSKLTKTSLSLHWTHYFLCSVNVVATFFFLFLSKTMPSKMFTLQQFSLFMRKLLVDELTSALSRPYNGIFF